MAEGENERRVGVVGLGFVGLALSLALSSRGYRVVGVDVDFEKVSAINRGVAPFYERGLDSLLREVINRNFVASTEYASLRNADVVFITVGTPSNPDGSQDLSQVISAVEGLGEVWVGASSYKTIVVKSTVLPGTTRKIAGILSERSGLEIGLKLGAVANPEFLREGHALRDIFSPHRVVIGCLDDYSCSRVERLWADFYERARVRVPIVKLSLEEAELVKYASNAFLAMRVSFANTIANICEKTPNCDVVRVLGAVGLDPRIGSEYLRPGLGYGGFCLPKDVKALIKYASSIGCDPVLIRAVDEVNERQPYRAIEYLERELGDLRGKVIGVLGVAFKPETDDVRDAVSIKVVKKLLELGATVKVHDPRALESARRVLGDSVTYCRDPADAIRGSDAVVVITEWEEYEGIGPEQYVELMRSPVVVDGRRIYEPEEFFERGVRLYAVGLNKSGGPRGPSLERSRC